MNTIEEKRNHNTEYKRQYRLEHPEYVLLQNRTRHSSEYREHNKKQKHLARLVNPEKVHQTERQYRQTHPEVMNSKTLRWRENHRETIKQKNSELRAEVLTHYGNGKLVCVSCGENRIECLSIDHINNNGNQHRREIGNLFGINFYRWLKKEGFPKGFQTLCMNDQFVKQAQRREYGDRSNW